MEFDYVFTSCEESINDYKAKGHENTYSLMFAAQPKLFNPVKSNRVEDIVVFAGSWYSHFPQRCKTMEEIFDKILSVDYNLKIYDRFSKFGYDDLKFPQKYSAYICGSVDFICGS